MKFKGTELLLFLEMPVMILFYACFTPVVRLLYACYT